MTQDASSRSGCPRQLVQRLESLQRAGVGQLPRREAACDETTALPITTIDPPPSTDPSVVEGPEPATGAAPLPREDRQAELDALASQVAACQACHELCESRTQTVFGTGNPTARLCFLGEAPGADEDRQGVPFVGRAGHLLDRILAACTLSRDDVYILNVLKCRPPDNRNPMPEEATHCRPYLERQLEIIQPEFLCCLGSVAASNLLDTTESIGRLRGRFHEWNGIPVLATYHPAYLLRTPSAKADVWKDMKFLMQAMGIEL